MQLSFAPMEGITSCLFRRTHAACFPGADRYFAPFLAPDGSGRCRDGAWRDLRPENNPNGLPVPQILCNRAEPFLTVARELAAMGYTEVNLNAGCPSSTVVPKHKGAGMLLDLSSLDDFLADVFSRCPLRVSVKTRLGLESSEEFPAILEIYRRYPLAELIVHARDRAGMYRSRPDIGAFAAAFPSCPFPVCYNGSVVDRKSFHAVTDAVPELDRVMLGRGAAADPALFRELRGGEALEKDELRVFLARYEAVLLASGIGEHYTLGRLKELWFYIGALFPADARGLKRLRKAQDLAEYRSAAERLFVGQGFQRGAHFVG
ncbi:MAG: tRNA-dihydrouridine synthase [Oscillospiraceae bacterium]|nr:tRNA-dihydrouridine synthase [Oscillospiraceae bacterium]